MIGYSGPWPDRVPAKLRRVILEELSGLEARATLPGADPWGQPWEYTRGGREGGVDTPSLFNMIMEERLEDIVEGWRTQGQGFPLDDVGG